jgi:hypothetical protein
VLDEKIPITENGRRRKIPKRHAIFKHLVNDAARGDTKALLDVIGVMETLYRYHGKVGTKEPPLARDPAAVFVLPHNGRDDLALLQDPELTRRLASTEREWHIEQQQKQNPANDNDGDTVSELKKA